MKAIIEGGPLAQGARVRIPASKSQAHRMLIMAALSSCPLEVLCDALNDDIERTADCLRGLGASLTYENGIFHVTPVGEVFKGNLLDCGESGSTLRFMLPLSAALGSDASFMGHGKLPQRPLSPLYEQMVAHGVKLGPQGVMPLLTKGQLLGGDYEIAANISSQFISGLLMALPLLPQVSHLRLTGRIESASYIEMTLSVMRLFGAKVEFEDNVYTIHPLPGGRYQAPEVCQVEGDWSSAAFFLVAGCISPEGGSIALEGLDYERTLQGDRAAVDILRSMGADIREVDGAFVASSSDLHAANIDCANIPDLVPVLAVAAARAQGTTVFDNIRRLRIKESDRVATVLDMLQRFGVEASATENTLTVKGGVRTEEAVEVDSFKDHRIAMAAAVMASSLPGLKVSILEAQCSEKSYPKFFAHLMGVGIETRIN